MENAPIELQAAYPNYDYLPSLYGLCSLRFGSR